MSFARRLFGMLESEVTRQLVFSLDLVESRSDPDRACPGPHERFRFAIVAHNRCGIELQQIRGVISPGAGASFRITPFELDRLPPYETAVLATIEAAMDSRPGALHEIAQVSVSGGADLSGFRFQHAQKEVVLRSSIPAAGRLPRHRTRFHARGRTIPLSDI